MVSSGLGTLEHVNDPIAPESASRAWPTSPRRRRWTWSPISTPRRCPEFRVCSVDPGYTATDLNGHSGPQTVTEGTDAIVAAASADHVPGLKFDRARPRSVRRS